MAFMIKEIIDLKGILVLMLLTVTSQATNLECYGKAFHCVNSTHFMICVDLGRGTSTTIDDVIIPCPSPTECRRTNRFECEFPLPIIPSTTAATPELATTVTTESEVTTFAPLPTNSIPFEEYFNTVSTTTISQIELQTSPTDTILSVKPITEGLDTSILLTTEKVITGKSSLSDETTTVDIVTDGNLNNTVTRNDNNAINVESNNTLNLNVIPKEVISVNSNQAQTQTQETELLKFNTEYNNLDNLTSSDFASTRSVHEVNTENIITTDFGLTLENITETAIISAITEEPVKISSTQISSAVTEQTVNTEQDSVKSFQDVTPARTLNTTLLDTSITLEPTQNVTQIIELQSVKDITNTAAGYLNDVSRVSVNVSSNDITSDVPEKILNTEQHFTNSFQEATVNATIPDYFSTLPDTTTPLESTQNVENVHVSQSSRDTNNHVTYNLSDVIITQEATTNIVPTDTDQLDTRLTELSTFNINTSTPGNPPDFLPVIIPISEPTRNTISTKDIIEALLLNASETTLINTDAPISTTSPDFTSTITEQTVTKEQILKKNLEESLNLNNYSAIPNTISTVETPHADIINISKPVNDIIDIGPTGFSGTNESRNTTTNLVVTITEYNTLATDLLVENNLENVTPAVITTADTGTVSVTDNPNYQEFYLLSLPTTTTAPTQTILSHSPLAPELVMPTTIAKEDSEVINATITENVRILNFSRTTDFVVTTNTNTTDQLNKTINRNNFDNRNKQIHQDNIIQSNNVTDSNQGYFTTHSTVPELITELQFKTTNILENGSIALDAATVRTINVESLNKETPQTSDYSTSSTTELNPETEVTTISFNNLETLTNTMNTPPALSITTENIVKDLQSDAERIGNDLNNQMGNITKRITQNEKVLSTNDPDLKPTTQAYNLDSSNETVRSTFSVLLNDSSTSLLELLLNKDKTKIGSAFDTNKLSGMNLHNETRNEFSTESTILPTESLLSKPVVNENFLSTTDTNDEINDVTSRVWYDNNSDGRLDGQIKTAMGKPSTSIRIETDSLHIFDSQSSVKDHSGKAISTDQYYKATVRTSEITTLSPSITIVDQNKNLSSELINTLQKTGIISTNTSTSLPSPTMAITDAAYVSPDYKYGERTSFQVEPTTISTRDQTEIQTETVVLLTQSTDANKMFVKNIDDTAVKSDVLLNFEQNTHELHSFATEKVNKIDTTKQQATAATHSFSNMPSSTDPALESIITPSIITTGNTVESTATTVQSNGYLSSLHDALINVPSPTAKDLLDTSTSPSDLNQSNVEQILISAQDIIATESSKMSNNISSNLNVQTATDTQLTVSTDRTTFNADESTMPVSLNTDIYLENVKNPLNNHHLSTSSDPPTKYQEPILPTTNREPDLNTQSSASGIASADNSMRITTAVPAIENTVNSISKGEVTITNNGPTTEINLPENLDLKSSTSVSINQNTVTLNTLRDINTPLTTQAFNEEAVSAATTEKPVIVNTDKYQNSTVEDSEKDKPTDIYLNENKLIQQTNPLENITLNSLSLVASNQEPASVTQSNLHKTVITIKNSTSVDSLKPDKNIKTTYVTNSMRDSFQTSTLEIKLSSEVNYGVITSNLNKEHNQQFLDYSTPRTTTLKPSGLVLSATSPMQTTTLPTRDDLNAQNSNSLQTLTSSNLGFVNPNIVSQFVTKSIKKDVSDMTEITHINVNHDAKNEDIMSSADNEMLSVTLPETASSNFVTKPIPTLPIELDTSFKQSGTTVSGINAATIQPTNSVDLNTIAQLALSQTESPGSSINNEQVSQISSSQITGSVISPTASFDTNRKVPLKTAENSDHVPNIEPTIGAAKRELVTADDPRVFIDNKKTEQNKILTAVTETSTGKSTETLKREANINIDYIINNTETATRPETTGDSTIQITASRVQTINSIKYNDKSTLSTDYSVPTEVITTADVLVDSKIESEKTHSGIISFITPPPKSRASNEKEEKPETKKTKAEEQEHSIKVELVSLQDTFTLPTEIDLIAPQIENGSKAQREISNREELLIKNENIDYKTSNGTKTKQHFAVKNNTIENILNSTNTPVSGYKKETPTHEQTIPPTNDSHTSNDKSQDQNMSIPQAHNKSVIFNDQSSTTRYVPQTKSTAGTQTTGFPALQLPTHKTGQNNFSCQQKKRGRYAEELDCRKFYICPGNKSSHIIEGTCPNNTVFSEINKQCTKNLSHCIRNNQFRCVTEGRFSDFLNYNIYYICVKNNLSHFIRFKLQCQNGYHLNKTSVRCALNNESTSMSESKSASEQSSSLTNQDTTEKPEKKFKCKKEGVFPDPSNCEKYFECTKVDSTYRQRRKECDSDEIFHKDKKKCVDSDSYECYT